jgi:predicted enzyme related to lactoylglutathione lyase
MVPALTGDRMIGGVHTILYSKNAEAVREFFRDVLEFPCVDAGGDWLVFKSPPGEIGIHPADTHVHREELFLMCKDIEAEVARLKARGVKFTSPITEQQWGLVTQLQMPDGERLGLYQPSHPTAIRMSAANPTRAKNVSAKKTGSARKNAQARKKRRA